MEINTELSAGILRKIDDAATAYDLTPFEWRQEKLRERGVILDQHWLGFRVNVVGGSNDTAYHSADLNKAFEAGKAMRPTVAERALIRP